MPAAGTKLEPQAEALRAELQERLSLNEVDVLRAVFTVLALRKGWSKARIGRYLGVTRARATQRAVKYKLYSENKTQFPELHKVLGGVRRRKPEDAVSELSVEFEPRDWEDREFAVAMISRVA